MNERPFPDDERLSSEHVAALRDWLRENGAPDTVLGGRYTVADLIRDLDNILDGMWSDGIDAMGEDA